MKLLAIGRPREGADLRGAIARQAAAEMRALWALYRDGVVREMYSPGRPRGGPRPRGGNEGRRHGGPGHVAAGRQRRD